MDAEPILAAVERDGTLNGRFLFLTLSSCIIATLGVLLNSPAVVIGSMLVAPLLGPIIHMGLRSYGKILPTPCARWARLG